MSFPRYDKYKKSGVEWLGEVPAYWNVRRLKFVSEIQTGDKDTVDAEEDGEFPFFVRSQTVERISTTTFDCEAILTAGDGVGVGKVFHYHKGPFDFHQRVYMMNNFRDVDGRFLFHYLKSNFYKVALEGGAKSTVDSIRRPMLTDFPVSFPPCKDEQKAISSFLDVETLKIDGLVSEQRRLIELLKEKRQAVISHAVTKGLNPNAPMKPSGIQWLGDVPQHWVIGPIKRFFESLDGRRIPLSSEERSHRNGDFPYYGASGIIDSVDDFIFDEDLVLVSEDGANLLNRSSPIAFVATGKYWVNNHAHILKPTDEYLHYWAERIEAVDLVPFVTGSAQPKFTADALMNLKIAVPPTASERSEIQNHFLLATEKLDTLLAEAERAIELLQERRTALISAAVTGKIDVRQFVPKEEAA